MGNEQDIDADFSGSISRGELLSFLDIPSRRYFQRVFALFDEDKSGQVGGRGQKLVMGRLTSQPTKRP